VETEIIYTNKGCSDNWSVDHTDEFIKAVESTIILAYYKERLNTTPSKLFYCFFLKNIEPSKEEGIYTVINFAKAIYIGGFVEFENVYTPTLVKILNAYKPAVSVYGNPTHRHISCRKYIDFGDFSSSTSTLIKIKESIDYLKSLSFL